MTRPDKPSYRIGLAIEAMRRSNCLRRAVGAVLVVNDRVVGTAYNGTVGKIDCFNGGCDRCKDLKAAAGVGYDTCVCVHAEQNLLLVAARHGIPVEGGVIFTTLEPCFSCVKESMQAGITEIYFLAANAKIPAKDRAVYTNFIETASEIAPQALASNDPALLKRLREAQEAHQLDVADEIAKKVIGLLQMHGDVIRDASATFDRARATATNQGDRLDAYVGLFDALGSVARRAEAKDRIKLFRALEKGWRKEAKANAAETSAARRPVLLTPLPSPSKTGVVDANSGSDRRRAGGRAAGTTAAG